MTDHHRVSVIFCALICFTTLLFVVSSSVVTRQITERYNGAGAKDHYTIACTCSNSTSSEIQINRLTVDEILNGSLQCSATKEVCMLMHFCNSCILQSENCQSTNRRKDFDCERNIYILKENVLEDNNLENASVNPLRAKRSIGVCPYPTKMRTADVLCRISNDKVDCTQTCIIGYTLAQGIKASYQCKKKENKWKPNKFKECEPYVDCTVSLQSGGVADCYTATTKSSPMCYVECYQFEDKKAVPRRSYTCNKRGKWNRKLPFCASAGSNIQTVRPPKEE